MDPTVRPAVAAATSILGLPEKESKIDKKKISKQGLSISGRLRVDTVFKEKPKA